jgi:TorA maturation chaperone TorD
MACEQTFIWASHLKKVICAMPQIDQFFLHRLVKYRKKYTEKCHRHRKTPILPKLGKAATH